MPGKNATPLIGWHSADPTLKPWLEAERQRRGMDSMRELLDEMAAEYRSRRELHGKQVAHLDGDPRNNDPANLELRECPS